MEDYRANLTKHENRWVDALTESEITSSLQAVTEVYDALWPLVTKEIERYNACSCIDFWNQHHGQLAQAYRHLLYRSIVVGMAYQFYRRPHTTSESAEWLSKLRQRTLQREERLIPGYGSFWRLIRYIVSAECGIGDFLQLAGAASEQASDCMLYDLQPSDPQSPKVIAWYEESVDAIYEAYTNMSDIAQEVYAGECADAILNCNYIAGRSEETSREAIESANRHQMLRAFAEYNIRQQ